MQAFFNGMSGLLAFSKGLDNVSNNVSNMNTPGYRGSDTFFRSVGQGFGADVAATSMRTASGETRQTGNDTDVAINGTGFFVLRNDAGELVYTRAGQFRIDRDGYLIESVSELRVMAIDASGQLSEINIKDQRALPPTATTRVELLGSLARSGPFEPNHVIQSIQVYDQTGTQQSLTLTFTPQETPEHSWKVDVTNAGGNLLHSGEVIFNPDGSPATGSNTIAFKLAENSEQTITLDFGEPGSFNQSYQVSSGANHTLSARVNDGSAVAGLIGLAFDEKGVVKLSYTNGEKRDGAQLALADFGDFSSLQLGSDSLYRASKNMQPVFGRPTQSQFGGIKGGYIELSNVDLAQEFGDILIIQRGYQASSRVMTVSNEMLEQLYNSTRGG
ncbi:MAG: flagellar hook-basal body complex protein [Moraxellaceae bacterium]|nr:flagellar hook-basal body complex protein [Moraxellaceae bacterium]MDZ4385677.1 flagellar hook-basal body complex protein [Moraxellaceae bacterium]